MKQKSILGMLAILLISGTASACQRNMTAMATQTDVANAQSAPEQRTDKKDKVIDTREYKVGTFDRISCSTIANIHLTQGSQTSVVAKLRVGSLDLLKVTNEDGCLTIVTDCNEYTGSSNTNRFSIDPKNRAYVGDLDGNHSNQQQVDIYITAPSLRALDMSGVCSFTAEQLNVPKIKLDLTGVCSLKLPNLACDDTNLDVSGVGTSEVNVTGKSLKVENSGTGTINLNFKGEEADLSNSGVGKLTAQVDCKELKAENSGVAKMTLKGTADHTNIDSSGMSKINTKELNNY